MCWVGMLSSAENGEVKHFGGEIKIYILLVSCYNQIVGQWKLECNTVSLQPHYFCPSLFLRNCARIEAITLGVTWYQKISLVYSFNYKMSLYSYFVCFLFLKAWVRSCGSGKWNQKTIESCFLLKQEAEWKQCDIFVIITESRKWN